MTVLNEDKRPFRELTPIERSEVVEAWLKGCAEVYCTSGVWIEADVTCIFDDTVYRIRPMRRSTVHWDRLPRSVRWVVRTKEGEAWAFAAKPMTERRFWVVENRDMSNRAINLDTFFPNAVEPGDEPWNESLQERPEGSAALGDARTVDLLEFAVSDEMAVAAMSAFNKARGTALDAMKPACKAAFDQWKKEQTK